MKVAIVHYWFISRRGGEKVVESILKLFPNADIYTLFYDKKQYGNFISKQKIFTSALNTPFLIKHYQKIFPLYPLAVKSLKLKEEYDLIISSESGPAKGIYIKNKAPHICYIHSPMRYCWSHTDIYVNAAHKIYRPLMRFFFKKLKKWDLKTVANVDFYIANSINVAQRVKHYYNREAVVVNPPIEESLFKKQLKESTKELYLSFGAITPYKKIDLLIDAFNKNGKSLVVIGNGSEKSKLQKKANKNIIFKAYKNWNDIETILQRTKALLFPGEEDFGMIPLEVMAYGIPVIAYKKGGALETVTENIDNLSSSTGMFFENQEVFSLNQTIEKFEKFEDEFDSDFIKNHAYKFREEVFLNRMKEQIHNFLNKNG